MLINYENVTIRNATISDSAKLCEWWNDGKIMAHAGFPNGLGTDAETISRQISTDSDDTFRRLIIELNNIMIGEMSFRNIGENVAEIGIKICDFSQQNNGLGTKILKLLITQLFCDGFEKIILDTNLNNKRAQHVYEKIGFKQICINYNSWKNQLGELQSQICYELKKSEFIAN